MSLQQHTRTLDLFELPPVSAPLALLQSANSIQAEANCMRPRSSTADVPDSKQRKGQGSSGEQSTGEEEGCVFKTARSRQRPKDAPGSLRVVHVFHVDRVFPPFLVASLLFSLCRCSMRLHGDAGTLPVAGLLCQICRLFAVSVPSRVPPPSRLCFRSAPLPVPFHVPPLFPHACRASAEAGRCGCCCCCCCSGALHCAVSP